MNETRARAQVPDRHLSWSSVPDVKDYVPHPLLASRPARVGIFAGGLHRLCLSEATNTTPSEIQFRQLNQLVRQVM
jgi:hypothetical protein